MTARGKQHPAVAPRVRQFQFMQKMSGQAVLRVVSGEGFGEDDMRLIQRNLGRKLDGRVAFTIESVEAIALTKEGKAIYVDQWVPR